MTQPITDTISTREMAFNFEFKHHEIVRSLRAFCDATGRDINLFDKSIKSPIKYADYQLEIPDAIAWSVHTRGNMRKIVQNAIRMANNKVNVPAQMDDYRKTHQIRASTSNVSTTLPKFDDGTKKVEDTEGPMGIMQWSKLLDQQYAPKHFAWKWVYEWLRNNKYLRDVPDLKKGRNLPHQHHMDNGLFVYKTRGRGNWQTLITKKGRDEIGPLISATLRGPAGDAVISSTLPFFE